MCCAGSPPEARLTQQVQQHFGENFDDLESASANRHGRARHPKFAANEVDLALA